MLLGTVIGIEIHDKGNHQHPLQRLFQMFLPVLGDPPRKILRRAPGMFDLVRIQSLLVVVDFVVAFLGKGQPPAVAAMFVHVQIHSDVPVDVPLKAQKKHQRPPDVPEQMQAPTTKNDVQPIAPIGQLGKDIKVVRDPEAAEFAVGLEAAKGRFKGEIAHHGRGKVDAGNGRQ